MSTSIKPYLCGEPTDYDLVIAIGVLFGTPEDHARELTPEQKAKQDAKLRPFMERASSRYSDERDAAGRARSDAARAARLKVLERKRAEAEA